MNRRLPSLPKSPFNARTFLRRARARFAVSALVISAGALLFPDHSVQAAARTWVGSTSADWAAANGGFNTIPVTGDSLVFGAAGAAGTTLTNTLTSATFNIAGIAFNAGAPAYTMTGNTFNLTTGITNNSSSLQTFNESAPLTLSTALTFTPGTAGTTISNGLVFTAGGVTTTVNGAGNTLTLGSLNLTTSTARIAQTFAGTGNVTITGAVSATGTGGTASYLIYGGSGTLTLAGTNTFTGSGAQASANFLIANSGTIVLSGSTNSGNSISTGGTGNFTETGTGNIQGAGGLYQGSTGITTLSGANTDTGLFQVANGTLLLDFSAAGAPTTNILNSTANTATVALSGGTFGIKGAAGATNTQRFASTSFTTLTASKLVFTQNGATSLSATLGGLTRGAQSTLDVTLPTAGTVSTTSTTFTANGVLTSAATNGVAYATVNGGAAFASNTTGTIGAITPATGSAYGATANVSVGTADAPATGVGANTLTFNGATDMVTFTGTNAITTGGILATPSATGVSTVSGGTITAGGGKELVLSNYEPTASGSLTISSVIADNATASALTVSGVGTTVLGGANTFTGQTAVLSGTLRLANQLALQNSPLQLNTGAALVFDQSVTGNAFTIGGLNSNNNIALVNNAATPAPIALTLNVATGAAFTDNGILSGAGATLTKTGAGTQTLGGANTYTGVTTINGGILYLGNTGAGKILNTSGVVTAGGGSLGFSTGNTGTSESALIGGVVSGTGGITDTQGNGNAIFVLDKANTYTGPTTITTRSTLQTNTAAAYDASGNLISSAVGVNSALVFTGGGANFGLTFLLNSATQLGSLSTNGQTVANVIGNGVILNNNNLIIGGDNTNATFNAQISGGAIPNSATNSTRNIGGNLTKIGTGTQTLGGANLYSGSTTINGGTLSVTTIANGGFATTGTAAGGTTTLTLANAAGAVAGQNIQGTNLGVGSEVISSVSGNVVTLNGNANAATNTPIAFGTANGLGISTNAAANLVLNGGTLQYTGAAASTDRLFTVGATTAGATGTLDASGSGALTFSNTGAVAYGTVDQTRTLGLTGTSTAANTLTPSIGDNGAGAVSVTKSGVGSWSLVGANSYSGGTTVNAGTLTSTVAGGFGTGNVTVNPTGIAGTAADAATLNSLGSIAPTAAVTVNSNSATAVGTLNFNGATPTIGSLAGTGNVVLNNAGGTTLTIGGGAAGNANSTFSGAISQGAAAGNLTVSTTGTVTLSGNNTYAGVTTINAPGILTAAGTGASKALGDTTSILVNNGGTLLLGAANQASAAAAITMGTTAAQTPASTTGILSVAAGASQGTAETLTGGTAAGAPTTAGLGALTLNNTATLAFNGAATTLVFGTFTPNGNVLNITGYTNNGTMTAGNSGTAADDRLVFSGDQTANFANFNFGPGLTVGEVALDGGFYELTVSAVPEPSTWMAGIACLGFVNYRLVRSRRQARRAVGLTA